MREGVILQDEEGVIKAANPAAERILGLRRDEATGRTNADPAWQSIREDGSPYPVHEHPAMLALKAGVQVDEAVMGLRRPNGELVWIAINARPICGPDGGVSGVVTTFVDVSERKQRAAAIAGALRAGDQAARWGGKEFIVAAHRADRAAALALAERLREAVAALSLEAAGSVTVSLGVALYRDGDDLDALVGRADKALYAAKDADRNRVVMGD